jgi:predicted RNA-binding protein with PIN domain
MSLLIDGYNLLNATGLAGAEPGPATLERSRLALLDFLAAVLDDEERAATTIVFDGRNAPPGLPKQWEHAGITVRFAPRHAEADELLEELIAANTAPRRLTVVSSDHRLHRAARRRRAAAVDSDKWYAERVRRRRSGAAPRDSGKAEPSLSPAEVKAWLREFGVWNRSGQGTSDRAESEQVPASGKHEPPAEDLHPFPPGYGEDVLREEEGEDRGDAHRA